MIELLLLMSMLGNLTLVFYARWLIKIIKTKEEDMLSINEIIIDYLNHLNSVHELETFYGEPTLVNLIEHGKNLTESLSDLDFLVYSQDTDIEPQEGENQ